LGQRTISDRIVAGGARVSERSFHPHPLEANWKVQVYFVKGCSDASPDAERIA
jgi:hypothetical protein